MAKQQKYKITTNSGSIFYAEVPEGKKILGDIEGQTKIWYENIEGGKYRGRGLEVKKVKKVPTVGARWLSFHDDLLYEVKVKKKKIIQP